MGIAEYLKPFTGYAYVLVIWLLMFLSFAVYTFLALGASVKDRFQVPQKNKLIKVLKILFLNTIAFLFLATMHWLARYKGTVSYFTCFKHYIRGQLQELDSSVGVLSQNQEPMHNRQDMSQVNNSR